MRALGSGALLLAVAVLAGCGKGRSPKMDAEPFRQALVEHLKAGSMEMKPDQFESIEVEGDLAVAKVRMATKDEMGYGLKPLWTVTFTRKGDTWTVSDVAR